MKSLYCFTFVWLTITVPVPLGKAVGSFPWPWAVVIALPFVALLPWFGVWAWALCSRFSTILRSRWDRQPMRDDGVLWADDREDWNHPAFEE